MGMEMNLDLVFRGVVFMVMVWYLVLFVRTLLYGRSQHSGQEVE
jgi:hypothetical protein